MAISRYNVVIRQVLPGDCHGPDGPRNDREPRGTLPRPKKCPPDTFLNGLSSPITHQIPIEKRKETRRSPSRYHSGASPRGLSPGLKNMPPACFLPRFARPPSSSPITAHAKTPPHKRRGLHGVGNGTRTHNARNHNPVLCQLNYTHHIQFCLKSGTPGGIRLLFRFAESNVRLGLSLAGNAHPRCI